LVKHTFATNPEYEASGHFMHARQLLSLATMYYLLQCGFPTGNELALLEMCNQLWSEICDFLGLYAA